MAILAKARAAKPTIQGLSHAVKLKKLSTIAALLERHPRLAEAVDEGRT